MRRAPGEWRTALGLQPDGTKEILATLGVAFWCSTGPVLDVPTYAELVKPSMAVAPFTYRAVVPNLFSDIVRSVSKPQGPSSTTYPASQRAEQ